YRRPSSSSPRTSSTWASRRSGSPAGAGTPRSCRSSGSTALPWRPSPGRPRRTSWRSTSAWSRRPMWRCGVSELSMEVGMENSTFNGIKFVFNGLMLRFVDFAKEIEIAAPNFEHALWVLLERYPRLAPVLLDGQGGVRRTHQMFLNGESMASRY